MEQKEDLTEDYDGVISPISRAVVVMMSFPIRCSQPLTLIANTQDALIAPFRALISKQAQRAYLGTLLFIGASIFLFGVSTVAYWIFYFNYIPQIGLERVVHLQFGYMTGHRPSESVRDANSSFW